LRAIAGEYDSMERHTDPRKLPVFLENQHAATTTIHAIPLRTAPTPDCTGNQDYRPTPRSEVLKNRDFRHAWRWCIDRDQLNDVFGLGVGTAGRWCRSKAADTSKKKKG